MGTYTGISQLKYDLADRTLREWAFKYGIVDLAGRIDSCPEMYLGGVFVDRTRLSANDKAVIRRVVDWMKTDNNHSPLERG